MSWVSSISCKFDLVYTQTVLLRTDSYSLCIFPVALIPSTTPCSVRLALYRVPLFDLDLSQELKSEFEQITDLNKYHQHKINDPKIRSVVTEKIL